MNIYSLGNGSISTCHNPADAASRGLTAKQLLDDNSQWLRGPQFLWNSGAYQAEVKNTPEGLDLNNPEVKGSTLVTQSEESYTLQVISVTIREEDKKITMRMSSI